MGRGDVGGEKEVGEGGNRGISLVWFKEKRSRLKSLLIVLLGKGWKGVGEEMGGEDPEPNGQR